MAYQPELEKLERRYADEPAKNFAQLAEAYRRGGRVDEALDLLLMHLEERPTYVSALIVLGRCHLDKDQLLEAAQAFERVLAVDGENIIALRVLAEIAQRQGDVGQARAWLRRLLEVDPMNEEANAQMAALPEAPEVPAALAPTIERPRAEPPAPAEPLAPADEVVIERASTEVAPPDAEEAVHPPVDLDLEPTPPADTSIPERSDERSIVERYDEPLWARDLTRTEGSRGPESAEETPPPAWRDPVDESIEPEPGSVEPDADAPGDLTQAGDLMPFDGELAWGTGERMSAEISPDDLAAAEAAHEDAVEAPAQELPGLEHADVPRPEEAHEVAPAEGLLSEELARAAREAEPLPGLEVTELAAESATTQEAEDAEEAEGPDGTTGDEAEESGVGDRGSLAGLPVFMPEADDSEEATDEADETHETDEADPEPVVTETMAELYARQGLVAEAKAVYRRLLEARPDDARLRQRLGELERHRTAQTSAADPGMRYEAARSGGVGARDFLRAVLEGRATAVTATPVEAEAPSPMDEAFGDEPLEPRGAPTRPASDQPSLASVFGEEPPAPPSSPPRAPAAASRGEAEGGFSFDQFFGESSTEAGEPDRARTTRPSEDEIDDTDESFKAWLKGLKS